MKNYEIVELLNKKDVLASIEGNYKFTSAVTKNFKKIKEELLSINEFVKPSKELVEFADKKKEILEKYSDGSTTEGDAIKYSIAEEFKEEYNKVLKDLLEEYSATIDEAKVQNAKYRDAMDSECTIDFVMIDEKDMPNMSIEQMELLIHFIKMK